MCDASVGDPCRDAVMPHLLRRDASGDPGPFVGLDLDGDGIVSGLDPDDPAAWF